MMIVPFPKQRKAYVSPFDVSLLHLLSSRFSFSIHVSIDLLLPKNLLTKEKERKRETIDPWRKEEEEEEEKKRKNDPGRDSVFHSSVIPVRRFDEVWSTMKFVYAESATTVRR